MSKLFYIQDTRKHVGNCAAWWRPDSQGYTCNISEAGLYSAEQTMGMRDTDIPWPKEVVESLITQHVSVERLHRSRKECPVCKGTRHVRDVRWEETRPCSACDELGFVPLLRGPG